MPARTLSVFVALLAGGCSGGEASTEALHVASESCPLRTPGDWQRFVEDTVANEAWVQTCADLEDCEESLGDFRDHLGAIVLPLFDQCSEDLSRNRAIERCTERLRRFAPAWLRQHAAGDYGFDQPNAGYFAAQTAAGMPETMMDPPVELLSAFPDRAELELAAQDNGWPYLIHDSGLGGVRMFFNRRDPEDRFEPLTLAPYSMGPSAVRQPTLKNSRVPAAATVWQVASHSWMARPDAVSS